MLALGAAADFVPFANQIADGQLLKTEDIAANLVIRNRIDCVAKTEPGEGDADNLMESLYPRTIGLPRRAGWQRQSIGELLVMNESGAPRGTPHPGQGRQPHVAQAHSRRLKIAKTQCGRRPTI